MFANGSTHICVQCLNCLQLVKLPEHGNKPFIHISEVPQGRRIHDWIDPDSVQGELI